jgi:hypothetical protein
MRVAERKASRWVMSHRGTGELAHEVTLESYRATFELGADGHDIDVRASKDGVLVCFHDDMLDQQLDDAYGDPAEATFEELESFAFTKPGPFGDRTRIPAAVEVLDLHRRWGGLLHLDVKRQGPDLEHPSGVESNLVELLDVLDMWDHVVMSSSEVVKHQASFRPPRFSLTGFTNDTDAQEVSTKTSSESKSTAFFVDDPRPTLLALGRGLGPVSRKPYETLVSTKARTKAPPPLTDVEAVALLRDANDWNVVAKDPPSQARSAARILARARAADAIAARGAASADVIQLLEDRVRHRSLHANWLYMGLDGARALRALVRLRAPSVTSVARFVLERPEPDPPTPGDPSSLDGAYASEFRQRSLLFPLLAELAETALAKEAAELCRGYLTRSGDPVLHAGYDMAASALLALAPNEDTAALLLASTHVPAHRRALLDLLALASKSDRDHAWARRALERGAPHALAWVPTFMP